MKKELILQEIEKDKSMVIVDKKRNIELDKSMKHYFANSMRLWLYMENNVWSKKAN